MKKISLIILFSLISTISTFSAVTAGAGIYISENHFGLNIIAPIEIVYKIREILNGPDIYIQGKPFFSIYPKPDYDFFEIGLGVRVGL